MFTTHFQIENSLNLILLNLDIIVSFQVKLYRLLSSADFLTNAALYAAKAEFIYTDSYSHYFLTFSPGYIVIIVENRTYIICYKNGRSIGGDTFFLVISEC